MRDRTVLVGPPNFVSQLGTNTATKLSSFLKRLRSTTPRQAEHFRTLRRRNRKSRRMLEQAFSALPSMLTRASRHLQRQCKHQPKPHIPPKWIVSSWRLPLQGPGLAQLAPSTSVHELGRTPHIWLRWWHQHERKNVAHAARMKEAAAMPGRVNGQWLRFQCTLRAYFSHLPLTCRWDA